MDNKTEQLKFFTENLKKIESGESRYLFYVPDLKGKPSGWLSYIYKLANAISKSGREVLMLTDTPKPDFVGVGEWLGEEFAALKHVFLTKDEQFQIKLTDFMFIPEAYAAVMEKLNEANVPCKRIAIVQNIDLLCQAIPLGVQLGDYKFFDVITNSKRNADIIKSNFRYANVTVIEPELSDLFYNDGQPKKLVINVVSDQQKYVEQIIKPFFWKHPELSWISIRALGNLNQDILAGATREAAITLWCDDDTRFGYVPLEAMACGSVVIGKIPNAPLEWIKDDGSNASCVCWFNTIEEAHDMLFNVITAYISDGINEKVYELMDETSKVYINNDLDGRCAKYAEGQEALRTSQLKKQIEELSK